MNTTEPDRIFSVSCRPYDTKSLEAIEKLKKHSKITGKSFSYLVLSAIKEYSKGVKNA